MGIEIRLPESKKKMVILKGTKPGSIKNFDEKSEINLKRNSNNDSLNLLDKKTDSPNIKPFLIKKSNRDSGIFDQKNDLTEKGKLNSSLRIVRPRSGFKIGQNVE